MFVPFHSEIHSKNFFFSSLSRQGLDVLIDNFTSQSDKVFVALNVSWYLLCFLAHLSLHNLATLTLSFLERTGHLLTPSALRDCVEPVNDPPSIIQIHFRAHHLVVTITISILDRPLKAYSVKRGTPVHFRHCREREC